MAVFFFSAAPTVQNSPELNIRFIDSCIQWSVVLYLGLDSTITGWSMIVKTMILAVLDQFHIGNRLEWWVKFWATVFWTWKLLSTICFNTNSQKCMAVWTIRIRCLICCSRSLIQIWAQELRHFTIPFWQSG